MKKGFMILHIILIMMLIVGCDSNDQENAAESQEPDTVTAQATEPEEGTEEDNSPEISEEEPDAQEEQTDAVDAQKVKEYLSILGLDDNADYTVLDQFPVEGSDEKSILMDINGIDQEQFDAAIEAMEKNGCYLVSDIMVDEEKHTTSRQYRNADDTLYIEMVYSSDADYINIIFTPINLDGEES